MTESNARGSWTRNERFLALILGLFTFAGFFAITRHAFVDFDDRTYIVLNPHVTPGLTAAGMGWAFTTGYASNWHPLTWISHMLDAQLYGMNAGGHHLTNLLFHVANSVLLFALLRRATGTCWRSLFAAALFAWHPLHVESVAWAAERKDVLSTFFFLLTLLAYTEYGQKANSSPRNLWLALAWFGCGLLCKPMLVTVPFILVLWDVWPLGRLTWKELFTWKPPFPQLRVLREKLPFFVMAAVVCVVTYLVQKAGGAVSTFESTPLADRFANAAISYVRYLEKTFDPVELSAFYRLPAHWPVLQVAGCAVLLLVITVLLASVSQRHPHLLVGWFWFMGTLVPTIGIIQVGSQAMADRYMYIPSIGLFIAVSWSLAQLKRYCSRLHWLVPASAGFGAAACLALTFHQVGYWKSEKTLFRHALDCDPDNYLAYDHLAKVYEAGGQAAEAAACYEALLKLKPKYPEGNYNLGVLLLEHGQPAQAEAYFRNAITSKPRFASAYLNLGVALMRQGRVVEAAEQLSIAHELNPGDCTGQLNLGLAFLALHRPADAAGQFAQTVRAQPNNAEPQFLLAMALARDQQLSRAAQEAKKARDLAAAAQNSELIQKAEKLQKACEAGDLSTASL